MEQAKEGQEDRKCMNSQNGGSTRVIFALQTSLAVRDASAMCASFLFFLETQN